MFSLQVSLVAAIPSVLEGVAKEILRRGVTLDSIKEVIVLSAHLTKQAAQLITSAFKLTSFKNVYGSSEAAAAICVAVRGLTAYKTLGFPAPNTQLKVTFPVFFFFSMFRNREREGGMGSFLVYTLTPAFIQCSFLWPLSELY